MIIRRHCEIVDNVAAALPLPKFSRYTIGNLRGGIGKTTLAFNLSYMTDNILAVDTCPQGNLSYFYDNNFFVNNTTTVRDLILPYLMPGYGRASRVAKDISATNSWFSNKNAYYVPSSSDLYLLPSQMSTALNQAKTLTGTQLTGAVDRMLFSLREEIKREMDEAKLTKCLVDTSPFFSGATHLAWHATDALIVPVRTDQQSINSLSLLIDVLSNPASDFSRTMTSEEHRPKIQLVVITHCGWTTIKGSRNVPNQNTKVFIEKARDIVRRNISHFTTDNADNHILLLDDLLGSGRVSTATSKPVALLNVGDSKRIDRVKTTVNAAVEKVKTELAYISNSIW